MREKVLERETLGKIENPAGDSIFPNPKFSLKSIWSFSKVIPPIFGHSCRRKTAAIFLLISFQCYSPLVGCSVAVGVISPIQLKVYCWGYTIEKSLQFPLLSSSNVNYFGYQTEFVHKSSQSNFNWVKGFVFLPFKYKPAYFLGFYHL